MNILPYSLWMAISVWDHKLIKKLVTELIDQLSSLWSRYSPPHRWSAALRHFCIWSLCRVKYCLQLLQLSVCFWCNNIFSGENLVIAQSFALLFSFNQSYECLYPAFVSLSLSLSLSHARAFFTEFAALQRAAVTMATMENKKTSCFTSAAIASYSDSWGDGVPAATFMSTINYLTHTEDGKQYHKTHRHQESPSF